MTDFITNQQMVVIQPQTTIQPHLASDTVPLNTQDYIQKVTVAFETFQSDLEKSPSFQVTRSVPGYNDGSDPDFDRSGLRIAYHLYANMIDAVLAYNPDATFSNTKREIVKPDGAALNDDMTDKLHHTFAQFKESFDIIRAVAIEQNVTAETVQNFDLFSEQLQHLTKRFGVGHDGLENLHEALQPRNDNADALSPVALKARISHGPGLN